MKTTAICELLAVPEAQLLESMSKVHDVELLNRIQDAYNLLQIDWKDGRPTYNSNGQNEEGCCCDPYHAATAELLMVMLSEYRARMAISDPEPTHRLHLTEGRLAQRYRKDKDRTEWALVSKTKGEDGKSKVLYWFGTRKPSNEAVKKQESRVQYHKHKKD